MIFQAEPILRGILDNKVLPFLVEKWQGIFRVGEFLCVTNGHACLALKSNEQPDLIKPEGTVTTTITDWLKTKSKVHLLNVDDLKAFLGPTPEPLFKCDKCNEFGDIRCSCKVGCRKCDADGMVNCPCGYTENREDRIVLGPGVFNRHLLQVFLNPLPFTEAKYRCGTYPAAINGPANEAMMILGMQDWRLFVMPMRAEVRAKYPVFNFEEHLV
jgi:hypothetical protein